MSCKNKRKKGSFFRRNKISILFLSVLIIYLLVTIINQEIKLRDLHQEEKKLKEIALRLEKELNEMEKKITESENLDSIEKIAREKLKMVKPNEIIYIIQEK